MLDASPYTAAFARLGKIRSAGITDLRYGYLLDEDWADGDRFAHVSDHWRPVPLPGGVQCYTIAATTGTTAGDLRDQLLGDGLVPLRSALGYHMYPNLRRSAIMVRRASSRAWMPRWSICDPTAKRNAPAQTPGPPLPSPPVPIQRSS